MKDVYVITGTTGGMGRDIAHNITQKGILLLVDLSQEKLIDLQKELSKKKIKTEIFAGDISKEQDIKNLVEKTENLGKFKALVHTAGVSGSMTDADSVIKINLIGTQLLMNNFYKIADNSVVINFASMAGHMVPDLFLYDNILLDPLNPKIFKKLKMFTRGHSGHAYAFSKKGVIMITKKEVGKWAEKNSRILSISPGTFETPMATLEESNNKEMGIMLKHTPIPRAGNPREITNLVNLVLEDEYINGTDILIDGGITSYMKTHDIFGLKENKTPTIAPILIYFFVFLSLPWLLGFFFKLPELNAIRDSLLFFLNPAVIILVTAFLNKKKVSKKLIALPFIISIISYLIIYGQVNILISIFYLLMAFATAMITANVKSR